MKYTYYERLTALDAAFLAVEDHNAHMHVGAVSLFDAATLTRPDGTIDIDRIRRLVEVGIRRVPRYQQRLATIPVFGTPIWIDDDRFNLNYHVRHLSLPKPGDERLLKRLAGRIMSQQLDRGKPLWELWVVDGVAGNRLALISKAHHCMIDGVGSVELTSAMIRATPELERAMDEAPPWLSRPAPGAGALLRDEMIRRAATPLSLLRALADPSGTVKALTDAVAGVGEALAAGLHPASATPLNGDIGPHRRFDWIEMDLEAVKEVKNRLGGTVNDVVLATVSGALRWFLRGRGVAVDALDFRAMIPVNTRTEEAREQLGNQVTMIVGRLPLDERDPNERMRRVIAMTTGLKRSRQGLGVKTLEEVSDRTVAGLFSAFARLSTSARPYNVVVTNIPGPQFQAYFLGAPMQAVYPLVPLNRNQAVGIALFSYNGKLCWGFNADWDAMPDLHELVKAVDFEFTRLRQTAANAPRVSTNGKRGPRGRRAVTRGRPRANGAAPEQLTV